MRKEMIQSMMANSDLKRFVFPEGYSTVPENMFKWCDNLETITLPEGIKSLGRGAFFGCRKLKELKLPKSLERLEGDVFYDCRSLKSLYFHENLKEIDGRGEFGNFVECKKLKAIKVSPDNKNFCDIDGVLFDKEVKTLIAFPQGRGGRYVVPETVEAITDNAFLFNNKIREVHLPVGIQEIGESAFEGCKHLKVHSPEEFIIEKGFYLKAVLVPLIICMAIFLGKFFSQANTYQIGEYQVDIPKGYERVAENYFKSPDGRSYIILNDFYFRDSRGNSNFNFVSLAEFEDIKEEIQKELFSMSVMRDKKLIDEEESIIAGRDAYVLTFKDTDEDSLLEKIAVIIDPDGKQSIMITLVEGMDAQNGYFNRFDELLEGVAKC